MHCAVLGGCVQSMLQFQVQTEAEYALLLWLKNIQIKGTKADLHFMGGWMGVREWQRMLVELGAQCAFSGNIREQLVPIKRPFDTAAIACHS